MVASQQVDLEVCQCMYQSAYKYMLCHCRSALHIQSSFVLSVVQCFGVMTSLAVSKRAGLHACRSLTQTPFTGMVVSRRLMKTRKQVLVMLLETKYMTKASPGGFGESFTKLWILQMLLFRYIQCSNVCCFDQHLCLFFLAASGCLSYFSILTAAMAFSRSVHGAVMVSLQGSLLPYMQQGCAVCCSTAFSYTCIRGSTRQAGQGLLWLTCLCGAAGPRCTRPSWDALQASGAAYQEECASQTRAVAHQ